MIAEPSGKRLTLPFGRGRVNRAGLDELARDPDRRDIDVAPLRGRPGFRLRIGGWRVIFERHEEAREIDVLRIGPRGDVY